MQLLRKMKFFMYNSEEFYMLNYWPFTFASDPIVISQSIE